MASNWNYPTQIRVGAGRINELPELCRTAGINRPLVVTDPGLAGLPMTRDLLAMLDTAGIDTGLFADVRANPTGSDVDRGVIALQSGKHDGVIALGGGSAIDAAKTIALVANQSCSLWDLEDIGDYYKRADPALMLPVVAIPTTAGTGSEVGRAALIVNEQEQRKVIIFHPRMMPGNVVLDAELTRSLPAHLTAATGMDALSHSLEAFCSPMFHPMAEGIALEGMRLVKEYLPIAVRDGNNLEAREQMLVASTMGATAFQRGLGAMHALAHPMGAVYDVHHGLLNAVLMPYVLVANRKAIQDRIARLAGYLNLPRSFDAFLSFVLEIRGELQIPHALADVLVADARYASIGGMAVADPSSASNPVTFDAEQYQQIADRALQGDL